MPIYTTRCKIKDLASNVWRQLEAEGWERVMSRPEDGIMKKTLPTGPLFIRITPVVGNNNRFIFGPVEDYIPGNTGVELDVVRTQAGTNPGIESFEIEITGLPTTDGEAIVSLNGVPTNMPVYASLPGDIAAQIKDALLADVDIAAAYDITANQNQVLLASKSAGALDFNLSIEDTTTGVTATLSESVPGVTGVKEELTITVNNGASVGGTLSINFDDGTVIKSGIQFSVEAGDTPAIVAGKIATALSGDVDIAGAYDVVNYIDTVTVTAKIEGPRTVIISITDVSEGGVSGTSAETQAGITAIPEQFELEITASPVASGNVTVNLDGVATNIAVSAGDNTTDLVAAKVRDALAADTDISAAYTIGGIDSDIVITRNTAEAIDITLAVLENGTGVTGSVVETNPGVDEVEAVVGVNVEWNSGDITAMGDDSSNVVTFMGVAVTIETGITTEAAVATSSTEASVTILNGSNQEAIVDALIAAFDAAKNYDDGNVSDNPLAPFSFSKDGAADLARLVITGPQTDQYNAEVIDITGTGSLAFVNYSTTTAGVTPVDYIAPEQEVNTITINTACTADGNIGIVFNDGVINKTVNVAVVNPDTPAEVAGKIKDAINTMANYSATVNDTVVTVISDDPKAEIDATFSGGTTGVTASITVTQQGVTGVKEINTITITEGPTVDGTVAVAFNDSVINKTVNVAVTGGDTTQIVAGKIATALEADPDIGLAYTVTNPAEALDTVIIERDSTGAIETVITVSSIASGVVTTVEVTAEGVDAVPEQNVLTVLTGASANGSIDILLNDGTLNKVIVLPLNGADSLESIANRLQSLIEADENYTATVIGAIVTVQSTVEADLVDPAIDDNGTGVAATVTMTSQGGTGTAEILTITVNTECVTSGVIQLLFHNSVIDKAINVDVKATDSTSIVAGKIKTALEMDVEISAYYDLTVLDNVVTITRNTIGPSNTTIVVGPYTNVAGVFINDRSREVYYASANIVDTSPFNYKLYVFEDHIILAVTAETAIAGAINAVHYAGRLKLYAAEPNNTAVIMASTNLVDDGNIYPIKDKTFSISGPTYNYYSALPPSNPGGGGLYYMAPIEIGNVDDGIRGEINHLYAIPLTNVVQDDTITVGTQVYDVHTAGATGFSSFAGTRAVAVYNHG